MASATDRQPRRRAGAGRSIAALPDADLACFPATHEAAILLPATDPGAAWRGENPADTGEVMPVNLTAHDHGGHFIPWELPDQWVDDLRRTFRGRR